MLIPSEMAVLLMTIIYVHELQSSFKTLHKYLHEETQALIHLSKIQTTNSTLLHLHLYLHTVNSIKDQVYSEQITVPKIELQHHVYLHNVSENYSQA